MSRTRWKRVVVVSLALLALLGCAPALLVPIQEDAVRMQVRWPGTTVEQLHAGRDLYVQKCAGCHNLPRPERYSVQRWGKILDEMETEAELGAGERETIERYVIAVISRPPPAPAAQAQQGAERRN